MNLYAWFPYGGVLQVAVPDGTTAAEYREELTGRPGNPRGGVLTWITLTDGSQANLAQIVRLEVADEAPSR